MRKKIHKIADFIESQKIIMGKYAADYKKLPRKKKKKFKILVENDCWYNKKDGWTFYNRLLLTTPFDSPLTQENIKILARVKKQ